jgi:hypothetical protein
MKNTEEDERLKLVHAIKYLAEDHAKVSDDIYDAVKILYNAMGPYGMISGTD